ncbi:MAG: hypothetical protein PHH70_04255 [Candidatus Gracilibacteria bacterium]|nr:hypothetical protein [Candidatus Gracilibacteria bacterium]
MKTKILAGVALVTLATAGTLAYAANTSTGSTVLHKVTNGMHISGSGGFMGEHTGMGRMGGGFGIMGKGAMTELTDAEKTQLATMTDAEKKVFFEAKFTAEKSLRDAKEAVIDKLINGETLSDAEKATLLTIKTERAAAKSERLAREAQMTEMKPILEKVRNGASLTSDEQTKFDAFKATMPQNGQQGHNGKKGGGMMGRIER